MRGNGSMVSPVGTLSNTPDSGALQDPYTLIQLMPIKRKE